MENNSVLSRADVLKLHMALGQINSSVEGLSNILLDLVPESVGADTVKYYLLDLCQLFFLSHGIRITPVFEGDPEKSEQKLRDQFLLILNKLLLLLATDRSVSRCRLKIDFQEDRIKLLVRDNGNKPCTGVLFAEMQSLSVPRDGVNIKCRKILTGGRRVKVSFVTDTNKQV